MQYVLHGRNLEPITVISLPPEPEKVLRDGGIVVIVAMSRKLREYLKDREPLDLTAKGITDLHCDHVRVRAVTFRHDDGVSAMILHTNDEEVALNLQSELLPGQQMLTTMYRSSAFNDGFHAALRGCGLGHGRDGHGHYGENQGRGTQSRLLRWQRHSYGEKALTWKNIKFCTTPR